MRDRLQDKHALMIVDDGASAEIAAQISLRLALEGCHISALAGDEQLLQQIARDIRDVRGQFDYEVAKLNGAQVAPTVAQSLPDCFGDADFIVAVVAGVGRDNGGRQESNGVQSPVLDLVTGSMFARTRTGHRRHVVLCSTGPVEIAAAPRSVRNGASLAQLYLQDGRMEPPANGSGPATTAGLLSPYASTAMADHVVAQLRMRPRRSYQEVVVHSAGQASPLVGSSADSQGAAPKAVATPLAPLSQPAGDGEAGVDVAGVYLRQTGRGRGVFAARNFRQHELIMRATGRVIDFQTEHSVQIGWDRHLETDPPVRFVNHSCEPNAGVRTNEAGLPDFVALRDIRAGEEITFDYAMTEYTHYRREDPDLEFDLTCRCGSANCRGRLGYYSELPDALKQRYAGFVSAYLAEADRAEEGPAPG